MLTGAGLGSAHRVVGEILRQHLGLDPVYLVGPARLAEDLGLDSIGLTEALLALEDELAISLPEPVQAELATYDDLVAAVAARLPPAGPSSGQPGSPPGPGVATDGGG